MKRPSDPSSALTPESKHAKLAPPSSPSKLSKIYAAIRPSAVILLGNEDVIEEDERRCRWKRVRGTIVALITHNGSSHKCFSGVMKTSRPEKSGLLYPLEPPARKVSMESQNRVIWDGKSRLLDEFLKSYFMIPINLRHSEGQGYPPADHKVRNFLTDDQSMGSAGKNRNKFYEEVIAKASEYESHGELGGAELSTALKALQISISSEPLFSFFLSTTGKITQFGQPRGQDASNRINEGKLTTPRPYIYLGFDQLMQSQKVLVRWTTLDHVTSLECIAHMGRPLWGTRYDHGNEEIRVNLLDFAVQKLLCGKPGDKSLTEAQMYARTTMRVCVAVGGGIESLRGIAPSEPILSEAASDIMLSKEFDLPRALSLVLTGFSIDQGDRGELLVAAFFAWARDRAIKQQLPRPRERVCFHFPVNDLFEHLFSKPTFERMSDFLPSLCYTRPQRPFGKVFGKGQATMHFNHVVKPQVQKLLARRFLLYFMTRGAAALGANCQPGFDAVYPYLYDSFDLNVKKVGFIIVQVKNDSNTSRSDDLKIFQNMDPFKCGILDLSDTEDGQFPIPIIRIVFSISGPDSITCMDYNKPSDGAVSLGKDGQPLFTSYDFMCSGIGLFGPVGDSLEVWRALVNKPDRWSSFYNVPVPNVLHSQLPGCGDREGHFDSWLGTKVYAPHTQLFILSVPAVIEPLGSIPGVASATSSGGAHAGYQMCQRPFGSSSGSGYTFIWYSSRSDSSIQSPPVIPQSKTGTCSRHLSSMSSLNGTVISELTAQWDTWRRNFDQQLMQACFMRTEDLDVDDLTEE
ncbi:hypothetical protein H4582DRAFT_2063550 [Lactarius indigo]|nr:hypothetical protein H4582DRAFT_2063550 [Lactarius indigo]